MLIVVMACYGLNARAQVDESKNFLYLYSDSVVYGKRVTVRPDYAGFWQIRADSKRISAERVKFFNNENGFFANTRKTTLLGEATFSERVIMGRINLFRQTIYDEEYYGGRYRHRPVAQQPVDVHMYYNKGYGDLKKVSYANLKADMADRPASLDFLNAYRKSLNNRNLLYVGAGAALLAGLVTFTIDGTRSAKFVGEGFHKTLVEPKTIGIGTSFALLGLGGGLSLAGFVVHRNASRNLENAVDAYNR